MGNFWSQSFPPASLFTVDQIPDLAGQVIIVTGGNAGIGRETIKALLNRNAKVYLAARSKPKADEAIEWLKQQTGGRVPVFLELDLSNLASVRRAAEEFKSKEQELHVLFNNAGVLSPPVEQKTSDGYDLQFGTNVLGHYFFTTLLLPILIHTAKNSHAAHGHARIINTSSYAIYEMPKSGILWDSLRPDQQGAEACKKLGTILLYHQSKLGNVLFSNALARKYSDQGIISISLNPGMYRPVLSQFYTWLMLRSGNIKTELQRNLSGLTAFIINLMLYPANYGALTQLYAGTMSEGVQCNGKFLIPWARVGDPGALGRDEAASEKLWTWLEEQVKGH